MWFGIVTLFPEMVQQAAAAGVFGRALRAGIIELDLFDPRDFTGDVHRSVDDKPYGGGAGMVMLYEPLKQAIGAAVAVAPTGTQVVLMSPQGTKFDQQMAVSATAAPGLILVCGRYEGVDERVVRNCIDAQWSIGDFVLSGGELPALVVMDAIARHVPGTLGNSMSKNDESHLDGMLDYPHYTRPDEIDGLTVPDVLLSGHHASVSEYRRREALTATFKHRPDLLTGRVFDDRDRKLLISALRDAQAL